MQTLHKCLKPLRHWSGSEGLVGAWGGWKGLQAALNSWSEKAEGCRLWG